MVSPATVALTMGDPAGVGPEICLRALADQALHETVTPIVFGDADVLRRCADVLAQPKLQYPILSPDRSAARWFDTLHGLQAPAIVDLKQMDAELVVPGQMNATTGAASYAYIQAAIDAALGGAVAGVTTGPINKAALHAAGIPFPGHTEMFAARTSASRSCMMQYAPELVCTFVTVHVGYHEVPEHLSVERIVDVIELTDEALTRLQGRRPRLVVCGLNPHAGEGGLFGQREEERFIVPAIDIARSHGCLLEGPLPPDTAFIPARRQVTDGVVCMYHDQGHIPIKALAFDSAVNTTLGLPMIRTSVDHGTAADIAWTGRAHPNSLFAALRLAARLAVK